MTFKPYYRLKTTFTLFGENLHGFWADTEEAAMEKAKAEVQERYPSFEIDSINVEIESVTQAPHPLSEKQDGMD